jgi:thioredoxin reductase (NADPH)
MFSRALTLGCCRTLHSNDLGTESQVNDESSVPPPRVLMKDAANNIDIPTGVPSFRPEMAYPCLTDGMVLRLHKFGRRETFAAGMPLWARGSRDVDMFVVLEGTVDIYARGENDERMFAATLGEGQFSGELDLLSSRPTLLDGLTSTNCILLRIERAELRRLMRSEGDIANLIMQATIWRRLGINEFAAGCVILLGQSSASETIKLQRFLTRNSYPHRQLELTPEQYAHFQHGDSSVEEYLLPAIVFADGRVFHRPRIADLADELGLTDQLNPDTIYDITIVGAGPAGLAAAVYGASEGLSTLVIEGIAPGGQAGTSSKIENYLGFPTGVSGQELTNRAQVQAQKFGAQLAISREVVAIEHAYGLHRLTLCGGANIYSRSVLIATGARYRKLDIVNYDRFEGQGIQYAATAMEATLCREEVVAVIGGGNSADQAAVFLSGIAQHVYLIIRGESLSASMSQYLVSRIESSTQITLLTNTEIVELVGESSIEAATWINVRTGARETVKLCKIFVMIGAQPNTSWLSGNVALDQKGFVLTGSDSSFENSRYATDVPGIYAVGDVRSGSVKRVASAVGEGPVVISDIHRYLAANRSVAADSNSTLAALQAVAAI